MSDTATLVVTASPDPSEMESVQDYLKRVMPLMIGAGGRLVKRLKVGQTVLGSPSGMVLVMDFDSPAAIDQLLESDDYKALVPIRDKGFAEMNILISQEL